MKKIAKVKEVWIYPVKSMMGISVEAAALSWYGFRGDRRYAFVQSGNFQRFPWLTAREVPELVRYCPNFNDQADLNSSLVEVLSPQGKRFKIDDPALAAELAAKLGAPTHLMQLNRGMYDAAPISVMSTATVKRLGDVYQGELDSRRFRQNIILEAVEDAAYIEDSWNDQTLRFGEDETGIEILLHRPIARCQMVNVDPESAERDARVLKAVNKSRDRHVGMYAWPRHLGKIRVGDGVYLKDGDGI